MINTSIPIPIGLTLPLRKGKEAYFEQSYDTLSQIRANIINLINTRPGERRMQPNFGCRLWSLEFEQNVEFVVETAKRVVAEDISSWVPGVSVLDITAKLLKSSETTGDRDIYRLHIVLKFLVNATKQSDVITLNVDNLNFN